MNKADTKKDAKVSIDLTPNLKKLSDADLKKLAGLIKDEVARRSENDKAAEKENKDKLSEMSASEFSKFVDESLPSNKSRSKS